MGGPAPLAWPAYLDALEEWLRRTEDGVVAGAEDGPEPFVHEAAGPLDPALALRARALLDALHRVQALARERQGALQRAAAYARH